MIEDFVIRRGLPFQIGRALDFQRIVALSDEDFARLYLEMMTEYREDGWWSDGKIPSCTQCHAEISEPRELRRYYGNCMHASCFRQFYEKEGRHDKHQAELMRRYWERVANLLIP